VYASVLQDPAFFRFLLRIDEELAAETRHGRCRHCGGPLHAGDYPRKPRGCPAAVREEYSWRFSFTCGHCDQRATPASVRFLGRRVYVAVRLMLVSPSAGASARSIREQLEVPVRTLQRWRRWWREDFLRTPFWQSVRERFVPQPASACLPCSLVERFNGSGHTEQLVQALRFVASLSS